MRVVSSLSLAFIVLSSFFSFGFFFTACRASFLAEVRFVCYLFFFFVIYYLLLPQTPSPSLRTFQFMVLQTSKLRTRRLYLNT